MQPVGRHKREVEGRNGGEKGGETLVGMQNLKINKKERIKNMWLSKIYEIIFSLFVNLLK